MRLYDKKGGLKMVNIILEEMKRQWEKGYIKVLLIVILLISILTGCFQVIKVN